MIEVVDLWKEYKIGEGVVPALAGINFTVGQGEFVGILGNSGSGKSTLIHLIAGFTRPTRGQVRVGGNSIFEFSDRKISSYRNRELGFVFQAFHLLPEMTALENVMLPLSASRLPYKKRVKMATKALEEVELSHRFSHKPFQLSGGQMQRVSIARAMVNQPRILIADEPTGNLDSSSSSEIMDIFADLNRVEGNTVIVVTHEPDVAGYADRIITFKDGCITGRKD